MNLTEIKKLAEAGECSRALNEVNALIQSYDEISYEALRIRAYIYNLHSDYSKALKDRLDVIKSENPKLKDYFLAANAALYTENYLLAKDLLIDLIEQGSVSNNAWFDSAANFLLAYCNMVIGNYEEAIIKLKISESLEDDVSIPIPLVTELYNVKTLRGEIKKRSQERT